jgi:putative phosphotransacetylase
MEKILCETSVRHVHLSEKDFEKLFGKGATLGIVRELSQPGQFLSDKRVTLVGSKGTISNVAVLGSYRRSYLH